MVLLVVLSLPTILLTKASDLNNSMTILRDNLSFCLTIQIPIKVNNFLFHAGNEALLHVLSLLFQLG